MPRLFLSIILEESDPRHHKKLTRTLLLVNMDLNVIVVINNSVDDVL